MTGKEVARSISTEENLVTAAIQSIVQSSTMSKSAKIRDLHSKGLDRSTIASLLSDFYGKEVRYQHVRNVLVTALTSK